MRFRFLLIVAAATVVTGCATMPPGKTGTPVAAGIRSGGQTAATPAPNPDETDTAAATAPVSPDAPRIWDNPVPLTYQPSASDVLDRVRAGFGLPQLDSLLVKADEDWYRARPEYVQRMMARSSRYLYYVVSEVEKRGMPTEIALLPMVESAYNPRAYSHSHAAGIWQFVPGTGRDYGLDEGHWLDNRRDILAATKAALNYLEKLYNIFGDWDLALAAYNCGEGLVSRTMMRQAERGLPTDYLDLPLPAETRNYVPKLMAIKHLIQDPSAFGVTLAAIPNQPYFRVVEIHQHMQVHEAARLAEIPVDEFLALNPELNRSVIIQGKTDRILLPAENAILYEANAANYVSPIRGWHLYPVHRGEKLTTIAARTGVTAEQLASVNDIAQVHRRFETNFQLLVPSSAEVNDTQAQQTQLADAADSTQQAQVAGVADTTQQPQAAAAAATMQPMQVADAADTAQATKATAGTDSADAAIGRRPHAGATRAPAVETQVADASAPADRADAPSPEKTRGPVAVKPHPLALADAAKPQAAAEASAPESQKPTPRASRQPVMVASYKVRKGDTLYNIARRNNVTPEQIRRWNNLETAAIRIGQRLTLDLEDAVTPREAMASTMSDPEPRRRPESKHYIVHPGDTLYSIARRFQVEVADLLRWNRFSAHHVLKPGTRLSVHTAMN